MTPPLVVAIDPGSKNTGIVARQGDDLLGDRICERKDGEPTALYAIRCSNAAIDVAITAKGDLVLVDVVAIEDYNSPTPQMGTVAVESVVDTAYLVGYLHADTADIGEDSVLVPPGQHGRAPLGAYPAELVTDGERQARRGDWRLRLAGRSAPVSHARSAWDVAHAARQLVDHDRRARRMA